MGRLVGPFGVKGWVRVASFTAAPSTLLDHPIWWVEGRGGWSERELLEGRLHGGVIVARLAGIATREEAVDCKGASIAVPRSALPPPDEGEVYWEDLPGFAVVNRSGQTLGEVAEVQDNGAQALLRVRAPDGRDLLVPFVPAVVARVDLDERRIEVDWDADW